MQRLVVVAGKELNFPDVSIHSLCHSFATHLLEAGADLHTIQKRLGPKQVTSTMVYLHLTHQATRDALERMDELCRNLPRRGIVAVAPTVLGALRRSQPELLKSSPTLSADQRRVVWSITHCRTEAMGGRALTCTDCRQIHFAWYSCNLEVCPRCGRAATAQWVQRKLDKLVEAPYFRVTFILPAQRRSGFFGPFAKEADDLFFAAVSRALSEKLSAAKGLRASIHGFTAAAHLEPGVGYHPHIHCLVPGACLDEHGRFVRIQDPRFRLHLPLLRAAFRRHLRELLQRHEGQVDPDVWGKKWGMHMPPSGYGAGARKYLGNYVARSAIRDARRVRVGEDTVTFRWKNRDAGNLPEICTHRGVEFVARHLRHVRPGGLRSIRNCSSDA